jgi:hypothetical protein
MPDANDLDTVGGHDIGVAVATVLSVVHFATATWVSYLLFGFAGGIETDGAFTRYGGIHYAWTNLAWLPGGLLMMADGPLAGIGAVLLLAGSGAAGYLAASLFRRFLSGSPARLGRWGWRLWGPLVLWLVWVPLPATATLTYWYTVAY